MINLKNGYVITSDGKKASPCFNMYFRKAKMGM